MQSAGSPIIGRVSHWKRTTAITILVVAVILLGVRIAAPYVVRNAINKRLGGIPDYSGHVEKVVLHVWRGAYRMDHLSIVKKSGQVSEPFFAADRIDFSLAWGQLFHGKFVSEITIKNAQLNVVRGSDDSKSQMTADSRWQDVVNDLFPIDITFFDIDGGTLRFVDETEKPRVDIAIKDLNVHATGLRNRPEDTKENDPLPAKIDVSGITIGDGKFRLFVKAEPLAIQPHFELAMELKQVAMPSLNNFLEAYGDVTVTQGKFEAVAQVAMAKGHYEGYVKPFFGDLKFGDIPGRNEGLGERIWTDVVSAVANLVKDKQTHQVATRIPFSGDATTFDLRTWKTIENTLHHGFVKALPKGFEGTTHPDSSASTVPATTPSPTPPKS